MSYKNLKKQNGFLNTFQYCKYGYYVNNKHIHRNYDTKLNMSLLFKKVHKKIGWSCGLWNKQLNVNRKNYCKQFYSKKCISEIDYLPNTVWWFGCKGGSKFNYK